MIGYFVIPLVVYDQYRLISVCIVIFEDDCIALYWLMSSFASELQKNLNLLLNSLKTMKTGCYTLYLVGMI